MIPILESIVSWVECIPISGVILKPMDYIIGFPIASLALPTSCTRPSNGICQNGIEQVLQVPSATLLLGVESPAVAVGTLMPPGENLLSALMLLMLAPAHSKDLEPNLAFCVLCVCFQLRIKTQSSPAPTWSGPVPSAKATCCGTWPGRRTCAGATWPRL